MTEIYETTSVTGRVLALIAKEGGACPTWKILRGVRRTTKEVTPILERLEKEGFVTSRPVKRNKGRIWVLTTEGVDDSLVLPHLAKSVERSIGETIQHYAEKYRKPLKVRHDSKWQESAGICISDFHLGLNIPREWSVRHAEVAMESCLNEVLALSDLQLSAQGRPRFNAFHIILTGDMVEGEQVYRGQRGTVETGVLNQVFLAGNALYGFVAGLHSQYPNTTIELWMVPGNHGRVRDHDQDTNWDNAAYGMLIAMLYKAGMKNVLIHENREPQTTINVEGWKYTLTHGRELLISMRTRASMDRLRGIMDNSPVHDDKGNRIGQTRSDGLICGHYHTVDTSRIGARKVMRGGVFYSNTDLARRMGVAGGPGSQLFFGVTKRHRTTFLYEVYLYEPERVVNRA